MGRSPLPPPLFPAASASVWPLEVVRHARGQGARQCRGTHWRRASSPPLALPPVCAPSHLHPLALPLTSRADLPLQVIKGWDEGVMRMSRGEKAKLIISSDFGYGAEGAGGVIPPNADLIFEVELLEIEGAN